MATTEEIIVKFRTEGGREVEETFHRVGDAGEKFHSTVTKTSSGLENLRLKSESRVANNIGAIAQALTSGGSAADVATVAFYKVAESFRGMLAFSAGASALFVLTEQIFKARDAADELHSSVEKLTSFAGGAAFRPLTDITSRFDALAAKFKDLQGGQTGRISGVSGAAFFERLAQGGPFALPAAAAAAGKAAAEEQRRIEQERRDILREQVVEVGNVAQKYHDVYSIAQQQLTGDETEARLAESRQQRLEDQEAALAKFNVPGGGQELAKVQEEINNIADVRDEKIREEGRQQKINLDLTQSIVDVEKEFLSPAEQNLKILELKAAAITKILQGTINIQDRERFQAQLGEIGRARGEQQRALFQQGPFRFEQEGIRSRREELLFQQARDRFQEQELQRRAFGTPDVRGPGLRAYEEAAFGPFQAPRTQQQQMADYAKEQQDEQKQYLANQAKQFADYNALMYPPSGAPRIPFGTNVNTGENTTIANAIKAITDLMDPFHSLLNKLDLLPSMVGVQ